MRNPKFRLGALVLQIIVIGFGTAREMLILDRSLDLATLTAQILKRCHGEDTKTIGLLGGSLPNSFFASIFSEAEDPMSTVLLIDSDDETAVQSATVSKEPPHKLNMFVITAKSPLQFKNILIGIKNSRWWNHLGKFYVYHPPDHGTECSEAFEFLWTAWTMDILRVKFLCHSGDGKAMIYMFNPYTNHAPAPWKFVRTYKGINDHPWTLFVRQYHENVNTICKNIDFDQTVNAGGYEVRLTLTEDHPLPKPGEYTRFPVTDQKLLMISQYMNVTFKTVMHPRNETYGHIGKDGKGRGLVADVASGRSDMIVRIAPLSVVPELPATYPMFAKFFAITQYTGYPSQWEKVTTAIDSRSRIGVCIVTIVTAIFLKWALRRALILAILDSVRVIICNGCFTKLPENQGPRIYLASLLCFVVVIQALYQGQLAARLTEHIRYPNVNNKHDLMNSHYVLYGRENDSVVFSDEAYVGRFVPINVNVDSCTGYVVRNSSNACVGGREYLINDTIASKLHMSKNTVAEFPMKNLLRNNWPLEARLDRHIFHRIESGIAGYQDELPFQDAFHTLDVAEHGTDQDEFKVLTFSDLSFAFVILGIGLACATISFVIEHCVTRTRSSLSKLKFLLPFSKVK